MTEQKITLRDVYDILYRVEQKYEKRFETIENKVDSLEKFQNKAIGVLIIASSFLSLIASYVWQKITGGH